MYPGTQLNALLCQQISVRLKPRQRTTLRATLTLNPVSVLRQKYALMNDDKPAIPACASEESFSFSCQQKEHTAPARFLRGKKNKKLSVKLPES